MTLVSFLSKADFLAAVVVVATMLFVSFSGYRRTRMPACAFMVCGCVLAIILAAVLSIYKPSSKEEAVVLSEWSHIGHFAATVLWGIGIVQLIRYVRRELERKSPPNESLHSRLEHQRE